MHSTCLKANSQYKPDAKKFVSVIFPSESIFNEAEWNQLPDGAMVPTISAMNFP
jgi:hypothetical protein